MIFCYPSSVTLLMRARRGHVTLLSQLAKGLYSSKSIMYSMVNTKIPIHEVNLKAGKASMKKWKITDEDKKDLLVFLDDLGFGKVNKGKKVGDRRQMKYLGTLRIPLEFFAKATSELTLKDVEQFEKALCSDKLKSARGSAFALSTKADIRKCLKVYLRWKFGDTDKFRNMTDWFDCRVPKKTPDYLSENQADKLYKSCKNNEERFLIAMLFDSGARAEEFHNIRYEDVKLPEGKGNFVKVSIKEEYSKTMGRCVSLYWKYSLEAVRDFLHEREKEGIRASDPIFRKTYDAARQFLLRHGKKILGRSIHYHLFRHSSATHYASKMNRQQLCYRYGWKFSSDMPDVYISRSGMENSELDEKFKSTELEDIKKQNEKLKEQLANTDLKVDAVELENSKKANNSLVRFFKKQGNVEKIGKLMAEQGFAVEFKKK